MHYYIDNSGFVFTSDYAHNGCKKMTIKAGKEALKQQAIKKLKLLLNPGCTVYTSVKSVNQSGMSRRISFYLVDAEKSIQNIDHWVTLATGYKMSANGGVVVGGYGMDMAFSVVYNLGHALWPQGTDTPHGTRNGAPDSSGGYALRQRAI